MTSCLLDLHFYSAFEIHVLSMLAIKARVISEFFSLPHQYIGKQLLKTQQKLCIMSAMTLAYLNILPRALIWSFNSWDYLFHRRTHYPMLEKLSTKNLAVCENQGKQHKLRVMKKKQRGDDAKKTKDWLINKS